VESTNSFILQECWAYRHHSRLDLHERSGREDLNAPKAHKHARGENRQYQSRFFAKALPEGLFKYFSKSSALWRSVKAIAVLTRHGLYFDVCGLLP